MKRQLVSGLALLGLLAVDAAAQESGQILGAVHDQTGALVPGVKVTAKEAGTGLARTASTGAGGDYVLPNLRPTTYIITAEAAGFRAFRQTGVQLLANQSLTLNIGIEVGAVTETVNVTGQVVQVDTSTSTLAEVVDRARIVELPLNGRDAAKLSTLVAGTVMISTSTETGKGIPGNFYLSANGSGTGQVNYRLDGNTNTDFYFQLNQEFPFPDALQEFSIQTSNFSSQYGNNAGAVVNAVTKSGTNEVHGGAFEFVRNREFNARDFFAPIPDFLKRNQFGAYLGGPVYIPKLYNGKNKTFFFIGWQGTRTRNVNAAKNALGPTVDEKSGNFTTCGNPCNTALKDPLGGTFAGNQIPVSRMDPVALAFANRLLPAGLTGTGFFGFQTGINQNLDQGVMRLDHQISNRDRLTGRYFIDQFQNAANFDPHNYTSYSNGSGTRVQNANIGLTHTFSPTVLNDFHFGYVRQFSKRGPPPGVPDWQTLGMQVNQQQDKSCSMIQSNNVSGFFSSGDNLCGAFIRNGFEWSDRLSWIRGKHSFSFGFSIDRQRAEIRNFFLQGGTVTFNPNITGMAMSDFLLGTIGTWTQGAGEYKYFRAWYPAFFIQDDVKVNRRLTLNLGMRWEPTGPWVDIRDRYEKFRPSDFAAGIHSQRFPLAPPGTTFYGDPGVPYGGAEGSWNNVAPRLGFAWDVFGDGKTSVRGGAGAFFDQHARGDTNNGGVDAAPWSPQVTINNLSLLRAPYISSGFPDPYPAAPPSAASTFPRPDVETSYSADGLDTPLIFNWNLTIERQVTPDWLVRLAYVGSRGIHQRRTFEFNPAVYSPGVALAATDARRLFAPYYGTMTGYSDSGVSRYNSFQASLQKRFSRGFTFQSNYTFSKSTDDIGSGLQGNGGGGDQVMPWTNPYYDHMIYGPSDFDHKHRIVTSYVWEIPLASHMKGVGGMVLGGWQLTGVQQYQTGSPMTVVSGRDNSLTSLGRDRAIATGADPARPSGVDPILQWFNKTAFATNPTGTFGTLGKGILRGPGMFSWDMGAYKKIPLKGERVSMQFRAEFFNIFNHPMFNNPPTSLTDGNYGRITQTLANAGATQGDITSGGPRIIQLALKLVF
jgi:hypothetical protein